MTLYETFYESIIGAVGSTTGLATDTLKGAGTLTLDAAGNVWGGMGNLLGGAAEGVGNVVSGTKDAVTETADKVKKKRKKRSASGRRSPLN